jgi:hypothetical protein
VRPPDKRERPAATPGAPQSRSVAKGTPPLSIDDLADRLNQVRCRCGPCPVHEPPLDPEPEYLPAPPPAPGSPAWSAWIAGLSVELGSLDLAYASVDGQHPARQVA